MIRKLELSEKQHQQLAAHCLKHKIMFLSSPFDLKSIEMLNRLGLKIFKIPSGEITNVPYLRKIGALNREVILSTGMATMDEVSFAVKLLQQSGTSSGNITLLHCHTEYPTPYDHVNLRAMVSMKERFPVKIGYSDHTPGIEVPIAAVALGAVVIEKHFTLDKNLPGPDHKASLNTEELRAMILAIRNIGLALGNGEKIPTAAELRNALVVRKSIFSDEKIAKGSLINENHICMKRPGDGISTLYFDQIIGKKVKKDIECGKKLSWEDLE
jgi:N,N'-diacetyllegionaminate synthase